MQKYKLFDHTADIGVEIYGRTRKDLFINSVAVLSDFLTERKTGATSEKQQKKITVAGADVADLLINFLRELLYQFNGENFVTRSCEIMKFTDTELEARLTGESFNTQNHFMKTEIKAVTYSGLNVEKVKAGWKARVIFDV
jgi:SHS2 domain-containing protein